MEARQGNPTGGKMSEEQAKRARDSLLPLLGVPQEHQANNHNIYAGHMVQTHVGPVLAVSVSVSQREPA